MQKQKSPKSNLNDDNNIRFASEEREWVYRRAKRVEDAAARPDPRLEKWSKESFREKKVWAAFWEASLGAIWASLAMAGKVLARPRRRRRCRPEKNCREQYVNDSLHRRTQRVSCVFAACFRLRHTRIARISATGTGFVPARFVPSDSG